MKIKELLKEFGSPLYVYDNEVLKQRCADMKWFQEKIEEAIAGIRARITYSTKANNNPVVIKTVQKYGLNVDCMSPFELRVNKECGFTSDQMLYVCNNIDPDEMRMVHDNGLLICLDSVSQVRTWGQLFPCSKIMVRINPGVLGVGHSEKVVTSGKSTKFGISESNLGLLYTTAKKYNLKIVGVHQHLGSLFLNDKIPTYIAGVKAGLEIVKKYFKDVEIVDLGGGFGVPYKPEEQPLDLNLLVDDLVPVLADFVQDYPSVKEFKFEPGRYIPCEAGTLWGTVTAVEKRGDTWWVGTDIGMSTLIRPAMYGSYHEISFKYFSNNISEMANVNICGDVCESGDILGKDRYVTIPSVGDIVMVHNAGAYGYSMASNYTGRPRPAEVLIYKGEFSTQVKLIRKRENLADMMSSIVW